MSFLLLTRRHLHGRRKWMTDNCVVEEKVVSKVPKWNKEHCIHKLHLFVHPPIVQI